MAESLGKQLSRARLARGLTIDAAAHATKMRPDKLVALENDDYSRFGSNAYAKGFLNIYGRFLGVDVSRQAQTLETYHHVRVDDYQYLNNAPEPVKMDFGPQERHREQRPPSIIPLLVFVAFFGIVIFGFWVVVSAQRLGLDKNAAKSKTVAAQTTPHAPEAEASTTTPTQVANTGAGPAATDQTNADKPGATGTEAPGAQTSIVAAGGAPSGAVNEVVVEPLKKTYVIIRRDRPDGPTVFEDFLYPGTRPLKLRGARFFVEVRDETAVQIRKNGNPIAYQAPGIAIQ